MQRRKDVIFTAVLLGVTVTASSKTTGVKGGSAKTDAKGTYSITGLVAGSYTLKFSKSGYLSKWWNNAATAAKATYFTVSEGKSVTANAAVAKPVTITGTLKNATGVLAGVTVTASSKKAGVAGDSAKTDAKGTYSITGLVAGSYTLKFSKTSYVPEWWNNATTAAKASYFTVAEGKSVTANATVARPTLQTATPKVTGTLAIGKTLKVSTGTWTSGTTLKFQWLADGKAITSATKSSFTITSAQKGKVLSVKVTGSKANYLTASKVSAMTAKIVR